MRTIPAFLLLAALVTACAAPAIEDSDSNRAAADGRVALGARIDVLGPT